RTFYAMRLARCLRGPRSVGGRDPRVRARRRGGSTPFPIQTDPPIRSSASSVRGEPRSVPRLGFVRAPSVRLSTFSRDGSAPPAQSESPGIERSSFRVIHLYYRVIE